MSLKKPSALVFRFMLDLVFKLKNEIGLKPENKRQKASKKSSFNLKKNLIYDEKCAGLLHAKERSKTHKI